MGDGADEALDRIHWSFPMGADGTSALKVCKYCREKGLLWRELDGMGWRLSKDGVPHKCKAYDPTKQEGEGVYTGTDPALRTFIVTLVCGDTSGNLNSYLLGYVQATNLSELIKQFKDGGLFVRIEVEEIKMNTVAQLKAQAKRGIARGQYR